MEQTRSLASERKRTGATMALASAAWLASLGTSIAIVALPTLAIEFSAPYGEVQAVVTTFLLALTMSTLVAGRLGDRYGSRRVLMAALALLAIASSLCAMATSLWLLIGARVLQGVAAAFPITLSMALMSRGTDEAHTGRSMGLLNMSSALGTALGPMVGGLLIPMVGWSGIFWIQVPLAVLTLILVAIAVPPDSVSDRQRLSTLRPATGGGITRNLIANLLAATVMMTTLVIGPFFLERGLGLSIVHVGFVMAIGPVISIITGIPSGRLVDAKGSRRILAIGLALLITGALLLALLPGHIGLAGYILPILVLTPGYQLFLAANTTAALAGIPADRRGTASGLLSLSRNSGLIAGTSLMGFVFASNVGTADLTQATAEAIKAGMQPTFLLAAGMVITATGVAFWRRDGAARRMF